MVLSESRKKPVKALQSRITHISKMAVLLVFLINILIPCAYAFDDTDVAGIYEHNLEVTDVWLNPGDYIATLDDSRNDTYILDNSRMSSMTLGLQNL